MKLVMAAIVASLLCSCGGRAMRYQRQCGDRICPEQTYCASDYRCYPCSHVPGLCEDETDGGE